MLGCDMRLGLTSTRGILKYIPWAVMVVRVLVVPLDGFTRSNVH